MGDLASLFPFILILGFMGLVIYMQTRQRKKLAARQTQLQESLSVGAPIMLTSGIHGSVAGLDEATVDVEVSPGVIITVTRQAILEVRGAGAVQFTEDDLTEDDVDDSDTDDDDHDAERVDGEPSTERPSRRTKPLDDA